MKSRVGAIRSPALLLVGVMIILSAVLGYYYTDASSKVGSLNSAVASLGSASSELSQSVASQSQVIQSLSSEGGQTTRTTTVTVVHSTTLTSSAGGQVTTTVTSFQGTTVTQTITYTFTTGGADVPIYSATLLLSSAGNGSGSLSVRVMNGGYNPITGVSVGVPTGSEPTSDLCMSPCELQLFSSSNPVSQSTPLLGGETASGSLQTDEGQLGSTYTLTLAFEFSDGTQQSTTLPVTAQAS